MPETQSQANAALIAHYIDEMGRNITEAMKFRFQRELEERRIDQSSLTRIKDFMSLPAEKRKALLLDPSFRRSMVETLDPTAFRGKRQTKKTLAQPDVMRQKEESVMALGEATPDELLARQKQQAELSKQQAEKAKAETEQRLLQLKEQFATGTKTPTAMDLLTNFDVKDPIAATLFTSIPKQQLTDIALASKNAGPMYEKQQQQEWYQKMLQEGLPPGVAIQSAIAIAAGKWDQVPLAYTLNGKTIPVRAKAEQQLAIETLNANSRMQEVQNTIANSIATSSAQLAEKSGLSLDQARANVVALRAGKQAPFPTPALAEHVASDLLIQKQEIAKNAQKILEDKAGVGMIKDSLTQMLAAYKEQGTVSGTMTGAQKTDLVDKMNVLQQELSARIAGLYGIKFSRYEDLHTFAPSVKAAMGSVWQGMKATGAIGVDLGKDFMSSLDENLGAGASDAIKGNISSTIEGFKAGFRSPSVMEGVAAATPASKAAKPVHTPEQESVLKSLATSFEAALNNPNTPPEQRKKIQDYINKTLIPVYNDPSKFLELFATPSEVQ